MIYHLLCTSVCALVLLMTTAVSAATIVPVERSYPQLNGVQVFNLDAAFENDLDSFFRGITDKGGNAVFFRVFQNKGDRYHYYLESACQAGVYFNTDSACVVKDLLKDVVEAGHRHGVKVFAWMATRSLSFLKQPTMMERAFSPDGSLVDGYGASLFHPTVRSTLLQLFRDLAQYEIDGILFQDDFILKYTEGAGYTALTRFESETGRRITTKELFQTVKEYNGKKVFSGYTPIFYEWAEWKNGVLMDFFQELRETVLKENPRIRFAANVYYETPVMPERALAWYSQSLIRLMENKFDYFAVMSYQDQIQEEVGLDDAGKLKFIGDLTSAMHKAVTPSSRVLMKLQTKKFNKTREPISQHAFVSVCNVVDQYRGISIALVPVDRPEDVQSGCFKRIP